MNNFVFSIPQESTGLQFWKLYSKWQKKINKELSKYKATHTQFVILASIKWFNEQSIDPSQMQISNITGIEKMTLSKAIARLEDLSFIKKYKSGADNRSVCVKLTDKGQKLVPKLITLIEAIDIKTLVPTNESDRELFTKILKELNERN